MEIVDGSTSPSQDDNAVEAVEVVMAEDMGVVGHLGQVGQSAGDTVLIALLLL